jgi:protease-4
MSLDADTIVDRRRMRRKLTFWRVLAVLVAICAVVAVGAALRAPGTAVLTGQPGRSIARVTITGLIRSDQDRVEALERLGKSRAPAVIVHINSPLVVVVDGLAASGGYNTALAADHIIAQETSLVGSIGVLFQYPNVADLLKTLGIKVEEIKSSPLKAAPNGFEPTSPEARAAIESIVSDSYAWFRGLVKTRRQLDDAGLDRVADGRVFTGRQGVGLKLVDELGDERTALAWLAKEKNIDAKTPVRDYRLRDRLSDLPFLHTAVITTLDAVGLSSFARRLEDWGTVQAVERLNLDGLLALWHPPLAN